MTNDNRQFTNLSNIMKTSTSNAGAPNISQVGIQQAVKGQIVTNPGDRRAIANFLGLIGNSPAVLAAIRVEQLNNKYPESM